MILKPADLPVRNVAYSACFRREAGSYGKDVRGLNRLHQFDKVEIVQIAHPDHSYEVLEQMREYVAGLLRKLELPFRIVQAVWRRHEFHISPYLRFRGLVCSPATLAGGQLRLQL